MLKRPKKELIDLMHATLSVAMHTKRGLDKIVNVSPCRNERGPLKIELTSDNMDLVLKSPPWPESGQMFVPTIEQLNV